MKNHLSCPDLLKKYLESPLAFCLLVGRRTAIKVEGDNKTGL